jgi:predicted nucleic acid-binding protein
VAAASGTALVGLATYDGSAGTLVDTNVWVDCIDARSPWHGWAVDRLQACGERAPLHVNIVVYAELLVPRTDPDAIDALLDVYDARRSTLPWACAALAAQAYALYRQRGGSRTRPLPDFYIGAHAAVANLSVLTRDRAGYASYFPRLAVIAPNPEPT